MTKEEYSRVKAELNRIAVDIETAKQPSYTNNSEDVLRNFKKTGEEIGITTLQAWGVHFLKQVQAILTYTKSGQESEPIDTRFADLRNYLSLGFAIIKEESQNNND